MDNAVLMTTSHGLAKFKATDATDSSFPSKIPTKTEPTNDGVIDAGWGGGAGAFCQNGIVLFPYGTGSDDGAFDMRLIGWRVLGAGNRETWLWVPTVLCQIAVVVGTAVGVAGTAVVATQRFADAITLTTGNDDISVDVVTVPANTVCHMQADIKGFQKLEATFDLGTGMTDANCLYAFV